MKKKIKKNNLIKVFSREALKCIQNINKTKFRLSIRNIAQKRIILYSYLHA